MIEAEITCECTSLKLPDLHLALTRGMVVYLDANVAKRSADLQRAWKAKGVSIKYVQRFRERRPEPVVLPTPGAVPVEPLRAVPPPRSSETPSVTEVIVDVDALAVRVAEILMPQIREAVEQAVEQAVGKMPVQMVAGTVSMATPAGKIPSGDDAPVFIPSKIGREDLRSTVDVAATAGEDTGVADAAAALKAARKSEKQR